MTLHYKRVSCATSKGHLLFGDNNNNQFPFSLGMATEKTGKHMKTCSILAHSCSFFV